MAGQDLSEVDRELDQLAPDKQPEELLALATAAPRFADFRELDAELATLAEGIDLPPPPPPREPPPPLAKRPPPAAATPLVEAEAAPSPVTPAAETEGPGTVELTTGELERVAAPDEEPPAEVAEEVAGGAAAQEVPAIGASVDVVKEADGMQAVRPSSVPDSLEVELGEVLDAPSPPSEELPTVEVSLAAEQELEDIFSEPLGDDVPMVTEVPGPATDAPSADSTLLTEMGAIAELASAIEAQSEAEKTIAVDDPPPSEKPDGRLFSDRDIEAIRRASSHPPEPEAGSEPALTLSDSLSMEEGDLDDQLDDLVIDELDDSLDLLIEDDDVAVAAPPAPPPPPPAAMKSSRPAPPAVAASTEPSPPAEAPAVPDPSASDDAEDDEDEDGKKKGFFKKLFG